VSTFKSFYNIPRNLTQKLSTLPDTKNVGASIDIVQWTTRRALVETSTFDGPCVGALVTLCATH